MAQITLDISGISGLAQRFHGNTDEITARPERITNAADGQMAAGLYNPYIRQGYLAPTTTTRVTVTTNTAAASEFIASEYDPIEGRQYWADNTRSIYVGSDLSDTSLTRLLFLEASDVATYPDRKYEKLYDLQTYLLAGNPSLYFIGKGTTYGPENLVCSLATQTTASQYGVVTLSIGPSGATKPQVIDITRAEFTGGNAETPFNVTTGTDTVLWAIVMSRSANDFAGCSWRHPSGTPTTSMVSVGSGSGSGFKFQIFRLNNPSVISGGVVRSFVSTSPMERIIHIFQTNNTDASNDEFNFEAGTTTSIIGDLEVVSRNQLTVASGYFDNATLPTPNSEFVSTLDDGTNTYGSDALYLVDYPVYGLQVGVSNLDGTFSNGSHVTWLANNTVNGPVGAFTHELPGDYAFMRVADNGFGYIFAGNRVHKIDGTTLGGDTGIATKDVLLFPDSFEITDAIDYRSNMFIGVHSYGINNPASTNRNFVGKCGVFVWNKISTQFSNSDFIELPGVREIRKIYISPDQLIKIITINDNGLTELREFGYNDSGGVVYRQTATLGIGAFPQVPDGLTSAGDKVVWLGNDGTVYSEKGGAIVKIHEVKAITNTESGTRSNITAGALLYGSLPETADNGFRTTKQAIVMSYNNAGINNQKIYPFDIKTGANGNQTPHQGDVYTGVTYIPITSNARRIRIYNAPTSTGGTTVIATLKIYFNQSTSATMPNGMTKSVTLDDAKRGYIDLSINKPNVHAIQIEVEWATGTPLGDNMYMPSVAIITTEETTTKTHDNG